MKNEMGGACGTFWGGGDEHTGFWWESLKDGDRLEDRGVDLLVFMLPISRYSTLSLRAAKDIIIIIIYVMELGHLLTRSGLTYPEAPSKVYHDSFCHLGSSVLLPWVIYFEAFYLHVVRKIYLKLLLLLLLFWCTELSKFLTASTCTECNAQLPKWATSIKLI
jgi:hypothetical protein